MLYRLEVGNKVFGNVAFKSIEDATAYLKELFKRADDRYSRALEVKNFKVATAIRQVKEAIFSEIQIVQVSSEAVAQYQLEIMRSAKPARTTPQSSCRRHYSEVA